MIEQRAETRDPLLNPTYEADGSYTQNYAARLINSKFILIPNGNVEVLAKAKNMQPTPRLPGLPDGVAILAALDVKIESEPINHLGSDAKYIASGNRPYFRFMAPDERECILFFWGMDANQQTSKKPHVHGTNPTNNQGVFEHHFAIAGEFEVNGQRVTANYKEDENKVMIPKYHKASPGETHAAKSGNNGAVVAIILENVGGIADEDIHIPFVHQTA